MLVFWAVSTNGTQILLIERRVSVGSSVKEKIVSKTSIMDMICLHLDRSVPQSVPIRQRWEHLADEFKVPDDIKRRCANYTGNLSPSEAMFEYLRTTHGSLTIQTIKVYLGKLGRNDVIEELKKNKDLSSGKWIAGCNKETLTT